MKTLSMWFFSANQSKEKNLATIILFIRLFAGLMMLPYGYGKIVTFDSYAQDFFGDPIGIGMVPSLVLTIFAQVACSILIILGFQTRLASVILAFNMMIAVKFHFFDPFFDKALPLLFLGIYIILIALGSGRYSLDYFVCRKLSYIDRSNLDKRDVRIIAYMGIAFLIFSFNFANSCFYNSFLSLPSLILAIILLSISFILNNKTHEKNI